MMKNSFDTSVLSYTQKTDDITLDSKLTDSLWCYVHIENFSLQVVTEKNYQKRPSVLYKYANGKIVITQLNTDAAKFGFSINMELSMTHELNVDFYSRDKRKERKVKKKFWKDLNSFSPIIVDESADGILVEIGGSAKLFKGKRNLFNLICRKLKKYKYFMKITVAPTPCAAVIIAKSNLQKNIWDISNLNATVSDIDLRFLGLQERDLRKFSNIGVKTLGDVYRLPRIGILERFSSDVLKKIDQLYGRVNSFPNISLHDDFFIKVIDVDSANDTALFENYIRSILYELNIFLNKRASKVKLLKWFFFSNKSFKQVTINLNNCSSDTDFLLEQTRMKVRRILSNETVDQVRLYVDDIKPYSFQTRDLFLSKNIEISENSNKYISHIILNYGSNIAYKILKKPSYIPERTYHFCDPFSDLQEGVISEKDSARTTQKLYRPTWLLQKPKQLRIKNGHIEFEGCLKIISDRERVISGWWTGDEVARDYFVAKDSNHRLFWIFKDLKNDKKWYLHGVFD